MKKLLLNLSLTTILTTFFISASFAQANYTLGAGIRGGGYENGLTVKYFNTPSTALEGILGFRPGGVVLTGLYEIHAVAFGEPSVNWFYGAGAHLGAINSDKYYRRYAGEKYYYNNNGLLFGVDGILGAEWKIPDIPFALSLDLHPRIELLKGPFLDLEPAVTVRYTF